jgi:predicted adenine nucleotide alpha hydrolase (AANH) superfamily ATPase
VKQWQDKGFEVTLLWYNPNIQPYSEHQRRLDTLQDFAKHFDLPLIIPEGYDIISYFRSVVGHERERCGDCFRLRLSTAAVVARMRGFEAFTTTLLISPYQKHELLKQTGEEIAKKEGVEFLYEDLRSGYNESRSLSQNLKLYRQKYCGCVYSEWERFAKVEI